MKRVFLFLELVLYLLFMGMDLSKVTSVSIISGLKFFGILICFFYVWIYGEEIYLKAALLFTVVADIFLLFTNQFVYGIAIFCIVQMIYLWRIAIWKEVKEKQFFVQHFFLHLVGTMVVLSIVIRFYTPLSLMESLAIFYFISIADNLYQTLLLYQKEKGLISRKYFFFGMLLFFLCDCNVGIYNMFQMMDVIPKWGYQIYEFASIGMWLFYLPAQVLLVLSQEIHDTKV